MDSGFRPSAGPGMTVNRGFITNCGGRNLALPGRSHRPIGAALMNIVHKPSFVLNQPHLLGIEGLSRDQIVGLLDLSDEYVELNRQIDKKQATLRGRTQINLFFEASTRTQSS